MLLVGLAAVGLLHEVTRSANGFVAQERVHREIIEARVLQRTAVASTEDMEEPVIFLSMDLIVLKPLPVVVEVVVGHCQVVFVDIVTVIILKF